MRIFFRRPYRYHTMHNVNNVNISNQYLHVNRITFMRSPAIRCKKKKKKKKMLTVFPSTRLVAAV